MVGPCLALTAPAFHGPGGADDQTGQPQGKGQGHHEGQRHGLGLDIAQRQVGGPYDDDESQQAQPGYRCILRYSLRFRMGHDSHFQDDCKVPFTLAVEG